MEEVTRRSFFGKAIAAIAGMIALGWGIPLLGYALLPAFRRRRESWSEAGPVDKLEVDRPKELEMVLSLKNGWMETHSVQSIWAFRKPDGEVVVYSPICPHLGCAYRWVDAEHVFHCPCHGSVFALSGKVLAGPAPRPLDTLPEKVENGRLYVLYEEFKTGIPRKEVI
ncbi:MAG: ubiquinol-cytochrome c reductase iron-sulfur subunit [Candidatus Manganitrophaceae bacterium]|nr:MAG: ubiquinol-cytochrome c reductase iron-sulfur subunit [Candidatus Manganitrophaceae bacterium]